MSLIRYTFVFFSLSLARVLFDSYFHYVGKSGSDSSFTLDNTGPSVPRPPKDQSEAASRFHSFCARR